MLQEEDYYAGFIPYNGDLQQTNINVGSINGENDVSLLHGEGVCVLIFFSLLLCDIWF